MPRILLLLLLCPLALMGIPTASAATPDELARNASTIIRQAENAFFKGDLEETGSLLQEGGALVEELMAVAPDHKQSKNLKKKLDRLQDRLDKKLQVAPPPKSVSAGGGLSSGARSTLDKAERAMAHAEERLEKAREFLEAGNSERCHGQISTARNDLDEADAMLDRAGRSYKLTADHPVAGSTFARRQDLDQLMANLSADLERQQSAASQAARNAAATTAALDNQWLARVESFTAFDSPARLQGPSINDATALAKEDAIAAEAAALLADYEATVSGSAASDQLRAAVEKLRFNLEVFHSNRGSDLRNKREPIARELEEWGKRLAGNADWREDSGTSLFIVRGPKISHVESLIADLATVAPDEAREFTTRLESIKKDNARWTAQRQSWDSRPRPFPAARMMADSLAKEMTALLKERSWKVDELVITDQDWWVQQGEFRYLATAALSRDEKGPFWSTVSFRQDLALTGYGPTRIWEIGDKVRLP